MTKKGFILSGLFAAIMMFGCTSPEKTPIVEFLNEGPNKDLDLPFSEAVRVGDVLFLAGQVGNVPGEMGLVEGGIGPETRQVMENIKTVLERYGYGMEDVVKCTIFMADISEWGAMNEVYRTFFTKPYPARSALGANGLALGAAVEIECIAAVR